MLQSYVLVWQEESLIQLLKNLWHHVNCVGNSYDLPSDKGYERILWKLRGYECVERLRTTVLEENMARKGVIETFVEFLFVYMLIHHGISIWRDVVFSPGSWENSDVGHIERSRGSHFAPFLPVPHSWFNHCKFYNLQFAAVTWNNITGSFLVVYDCNKHMDLSPHALALGIYFPNKRSTCGPVAEISVTIHKCRLFSRPIN